MEHTFKNITDMMAATKKPKKPVVFQYLKMLVKPALASMRWTALTPGWEGIRGRMDLADGRLISIRQATKCLAEPTPFRDASFTEDIGTTPGWQDGMWEVAIMKYGEVIWGGDDFALHSDELVQFVANAEAGALPADCRDYPVYHQDGEV